MNPGEIEKRLAAIEARLGRVESLLPKASAPPPAQPPQGDTAKAAPAKPEGEDRPSLVTSILGWGGAVALVLAAAYLIRLAVESGWLTPVRQVTFAAIFGFVMIGAGFLLFRFFDIVKPPPIRMIDKRVHGGVGVVMDDVVAGVFANLVLRTGIWLLN